MVKKISYSWVMVGVSFIVSAILNASRFIFGILFKSFESDFLLSRTATSAVYSVYNVFGAIFTPVSGWFFDRYGLKRTILLMGFITGLGLLLVSQATSSWHLFVGYGVLLGMGTGGTYIVLMAAVPRWFAKNRGLALGITSSGLALGAVVIPPFGTYLISAFNWRVSLVIIGIATWVIVMSLALLLRDYPKETKAVASGLEVNGTPTKNQDSQGTDLTLVGALRTRNYWFITSGFFFHGLCGSMMAAHVVPFAIDSNISPMEAATILSMVGIFNLVSRVITGRVLDIFGKRIPALTSAGLLAVVMVWLIWSRYLWTFYLFGIVLGIFWGAFAIIVVTLAIDNFSGRNLGMIMGVIDVGWSMGAAVGPAIGGFSFDVTGSYTLALIAGAISSLLAGGFVILSTSQARPKVESDSR